MMIGGTDVIFQTRMRGAALDLCIRLIRQEWPQAVFEEPDGDELVRRYDRLAFQRMSQLFVYRDEAAANAWDEKEIDPTIAATMIYLLSSANTITLVVGDPKDETIARILDSVERALRMDIFNCAAERGAPRRAA